MSWNTGTGLTSPPLKACPAQDQLMLASGRPQWRSQHALQLSPDQAPLQPLLLQKGKPAWRSLSMLSQEVAFSTLPLLPSLYFVQTNAFQESQSSLRRWRAGIPRLPIVTGMERAAWQVDHPGWSTACPAGLEGWGWAGGGGEKVLSGVDLLLWCTAARFSFFREVIW